MLSDMETDYGIGMVYKGTQIVIVVVVIAVLANLMFTSIIGKVC